MPNPIYFVRHGETYWNVSHQICGRTDIALTPKGHEQAEATGHHLQQLGIRPDIIYCSPLIRAEETARHIAGVLSVPMLAEPALIEQHFGKYESTARNGEDFRRAKAQFVQSYEGGESMLRLAQRIYTLLDRLREESETRTILLVAHNGIARVVESYFRDMTNEEYAAFGVPNCAVIRYDWNGHSEIL